MSKSWLVWSNLGMVLPSTIVLSYGNVVLSGAAFFVMLFSVFHHLAERSMWRSFDTVWESIDVVFSISFLLCGPYILWSSRSSPFAWRICILLCLYALGVYVVSRQYRLAQRVENYIVWHSLWHVSAAALVTGVYLSYFGVIT
jgi:NhaP-type Na+/H+ or K+/H+ antiporter